VHVSCFYRWTDSGCRGVILESLQVGATCCTSIEALARFFARLTSGTVETAPAQNTVAGRERSIEAAERKLDAVLKD
jgi:hypothetical protein